MTDIVLINPGDRKQVFQSLGIDVAAIEPPFWVAVLGAYLRQEGYDVRIIDSNAENITPEETAKRIAEFAPKLACVIVYGSQPSASTQNMTIAGKICAAIHKTCECKVAIGGLHPSALPERTIKEERVDFVIDGEGPFTLSSLLNKLTKESLQYADVPGLWWRDSAGNIEHTDRAPLIQEIDNVLPMGAWDLLPMHLYRAHNWHCFDNIENRTPYGAIYTSLGCPFSCKFCCINAPFGGSGIRFRSPEAVLDEMEVLARYYGIYNLKIIDELFVLRDSHYMAIVDGIIERGLNFNIWAYSRINTLNPDNLERMKKAGINWLALGIESANTSVQDEINKKIDLNDIRTVVRKIQDAGIRVIGNFIFGLPDDTIESMRQTLDLAKELNCEFVNFYCAMAYPGSELYRESVEAGHPLPDSWHAFSQHAYDTLPLPTKHLSAADVIRFRDNAFHDYFQDPRYLNMLETKFGTTVRRHVEEITKTRLKRKLTE